MQEDFLKFFVRPRLMSLFFVPLHAHKNAYYIINVKI